MPQSLDPGAFPDFGPIGPRLLPYSQGAPAMFLTGEESLRIRSLNSAAGVTLAIEGRILRPDGCIDPMSNPHTPNTDRTAATTVMALGGGWVQHLSVRASAGAPRVGQCYVVVEIVRGQTGAFQPLGVALQGYVTDTSGLAWPGSPFLSSPDGPGVIRSIAGTNPGAGNEWSETVPTNARWRLLAARFTLDTDANVANREVVLTIDDGASIVAEVASGTAHAAGVQRRYTFARNVQRGAPAASTVIDAPAPDAILMAGYRVRSVTTNLQAGDDFSAPQLWVEEWIED